MNYCENNPDTCRNGAKCLSLTADEGNYVCMCREGFYGKNCEKSESDKFTAKPNVTTTQKSTTTKDATTTEQPPMIVTPVKPSDIENETI